MSLMFSLSRVDSFGILVDGESSGESAISLVAVVVEDLRQDVDADAVDAVVTVESDEVF